jgi:translation initiation factor 1
MKSNDDYELVYSDDGSHLKKEKVKKPDPKPSDHTLKIRLEKNSRGGKTVSVVFELPDAPDYFEKITKELKNKCGTGGSFKNNQIEIQGDHRIKIKEHLEKLGFKVKLAGG